MESHGMLNWLLLCVPVTLALEYLAPQQHLAIFIAAAIAIIPLAGWLGKATEQLAERSGEGVGGLLNATFGYATELIIAIAALRAGLHNYITNHGPILTTYEEIGQAFPAHYL